MKYYYVTFSNHINGDLCEVNPSRFSTKEEAELFGNAWLYAYKRNYGYCNFDSFFVTEAPEYITDLKEALAKMHLTTKKAEELLSWNQYETSKEYLDYGYDVDGCYDRFYDITEDGKVIDTLNAQDRENWDDDTNWEDDDHWAPESRGAYDEGIEEMQERKQAEQDELLYEELWEEEPKGYALYTKYMMLKWINTFK